MPYELPSVTLTVKAAMQQLVPEEVERRRIEQEEIDAEEDDTCYGGFKCWQVVHAAQTIGFGRQVGVRQGTPGILVGNCSDGSHVTVKFEQREDGSELCVNVLPSTLMHPLPAGFRLGQKVAAASDLFMDAAVVVKLGAVGTISERTSEDHMHVLFEESVDGRQCYVNLHHEMIRVDRQLVGGFKLGQRIQANLDLQINANCSIPYGTPGIVVGEYSDTRLTVAFDHDTEDSLGRTLVNLLPLEIRVFSDTPCDMPPGQAVKALTDLFSTNVAVQAGTRGVVVGCHDEMTIVVAFDGTEEVNTTQCLTVAIGSIEKITNDENRTDELNRLVSTDVE